MATVADPKAQQYKPVTGSAVLDSKGRISLPKAVCEALRVETGATLEYMVIGGALLLLPQDGQRRVWTDRAAAIHGESDEEVDPVVQAMLDELPAIRDQVARETYGDAFIDELERKHAAILAAQEGQREVDPGDAER